MTLNDPDYNYDSDQTSTWTKLPYNVLKALKDIVKMLIERYPDCLGAHFYFTPGGENGGFYSIYTLNILNPNKILSYEFNDCDSYEYTSRNKKENEKGVVAGSNWWYIMNTLSYKAYIFMRQENPKLPNIKVSSIVYKI